MAKKKTYSSDDIQTLHFPESVRKRFSMYIGSGETAVEHLLRRNFR